MAGTERKFVDNIHIKAPFQFKIRKFIPQERKTINEIYLFVSYTYLAIFV